MRFIATDAFWGRVKISLPPGLRPGKGACSAIEKAFACAWCKCLEAEACLSNIVLLPEALGSGRLEEDRDLEGEVMPRDAGDPAAGDPMEGKFADSLEKHHKNNCGCCCWRYHCFF